MSKPVAHQALSDDRTCACGARFRKLRELRRHVKIEARPPEPTVWRAAGVPHYRNRRG